MEISSNTIKGMTAEEFREHVRESAKGEQEERVAELAAKYPEFAEIKSRLLAIGGDEVEGGKFRHGSELPENIPPGRLSFVST